MSRGRTCLQKISDHPDPEWSENFFYLLLEMIKYWGEKGQGQRQGLYVHYAELYNDLRSKQVAFPPGKKFLDWPIDEPVPNK